MNRGEKKNKKKVVPYNVFALKYAIYMLMLSVILSKYMN